MDLLSTACTAERREKSHYKMHADNRPFHVDGWEDVGGGAAQHAQNLSL